MREIETGRRVTAVFFSERPVDCFCHDENAKG